MTLIPILTKASSQLKGNNWTDSKKVTYFSESENFMPTTITILCIYPLGSHHLYGNNLLKRSGLTKKVLELLGIFKKNTYIKFVILFSRKTKVYCLTLDGLYFTYPKWLVFDLHDLVCICQLSYLGWFVFELLGMVFSYLTWDGLYFDLHRIICIWLA